MAHLRLFQQALIKAKSDFQEDISVLLNNSINDYTVLYFYIFVLKSNPFA